MLVSLRGDVEVSLPAKRIAQYQRWCERLGPKSLQEVNASLTEYVDNILNSKRAPIVEARWVIKHRWKAPFNQILGAVRKNPSVGEIFFGLLLWHMLLEREEEWVFLIDPKDRKFMRYFFRVQCYQEA